jgi:hypothetical protein
MTLAPGVDNVIAALGQSNRVREVILFAHANWELEKFLAAMQVSFPELTELRLWSLDETSPASPPVIPDSFLDGSAPRLRDFSLCGIPFPGLPKLLLSATHLVHLCLNSIPHSGYISPEAMVALLSVLSGLKTLSLGFRSPQSRPDWETRSLSPPKRSILPALDKFQFDGFTEYLEDLVTRIDTPQLDEMRITFFNQIDFDCPRLIQFINCTPTLRARDEAYLQFDDTYAHVTLPSGHRSLDIGISFREPYRQLWSVAQICNFSLPPPSAVEDLYIERQFGYVKLVWKNAYDAIEHTTLWLHLLLPFTAVKNLYLSKEFAPIIAGALQKLVGTGITEVLPSLRNIFVEELEPGELFRITLGSLMPRDSSPIPLSPFLFLGQRLQREVDVMQPVSYSPFSLAFTFILYHFSLTLTYHLLVWATWSHGAAPRQPDSGRSPAYTSPREYICVARLGAMQYSQFSSHRTPTRRPFLFQTPCPFSDNEMLPVALQPTEATASPTIASDATAVAPYVLSDWERTNYYNGISPDHPELLYRSDLLKNTFPIPKGRHPHLPTKTVYGVFNTSLNAVWDTVAPQIREFLKARKIRYSAIKTARFVTHGGKDTLDPVVIWIATHPTTTTAENAHDRVASTPRTLVRSRLMRRGSRSSSRATSST